MARIFGWILMLLGVVLVVLKLVFKKQTEKIVFLSNLNVLLAVVIGLILIAVGFLLSKEKGRQVNEEVPIYEGNKIVGYRRK